MTQANNQNTGDNSEKPDPVDGEGKTLKEGDRVFTLDFSFFGDWTRYYGTLRRNVQYPQVSDWYIEFYDGQECAVLDFSQVFKAEHDTN